VFRFLLKISNGPFLVLLFTLGVGVQTALFRESGLRYFQPNLCVSLVLWFALRRNLAEGGGLVLLLGYVEELHSHVPQGFALLQNVLLFFGLRLTVRYLLIQSLASYALLAIGASLVAKALSFLLMVLFGAGLPPLTHGLMFGVLGALSQCVLSLCLYPFLEKIDTLMFKPALQGRRIQESWHEGA
jgi:cell shape-determining protein MreD